MVEVKQKEQVGRKVREVRSTCKAGGVVCEVSTGEGHTIVTDEPTERGGTDTASAPLFHLAASLATCQTVQIVKVAEAMRFVHGDINIDCSTVTDLIDGLEGNNNGVMHFCEAEMIIDIETDESEKKIERLKALSEDRCPVDRLFIEAGYPPKVTWNVLPMPA
ncbi:MAG: OsmC family protein [Alphaproteobacteria bacterium]